MSHPEDYILLHTMNGEVVCISGIEGFEQQRVSSLLSERR